MRPHVASTRRGRIGTETRGPWFARLRRLVIAAVKSRVAHVVTAAVLVAAAESVTAAYVARAGNYRPVLREVVRAGARAMLQFGFAAGGMAVDIADSVSRLVVGLVRVGLRCFRQWARGGAGVHVQ